MLWVGRACESRHSSWLKTVDTGPVPLWNAEFVRSAQERIHPVLRHGSAVLSVSVLCCDWALMRRERGGEKERERERDRERN